MSLIHIIAQSAGPALVVSPWKMALFFLPFMAWGWLIATKLDKDARKYRLNPTVWNSVHLAAGVAALAAMLFIPIFWASWPVGMGILLTPILIYWRVRNEAVEEHEQFYLSGATIAERLESRRIKKAARGAVIHFSNHSGTELPAPMKDEPLYEIHMLAEDVFGPALEEHAGRIELLVTPKGTAVTFTIDGMKLKREPMSAEHGLQVCDYVKELAGLDIEDRRKRQRGTCKVFGEESKHELTVTTSGSSGGQMLRADVDLSKQIDRPFKKLGLLGSQVELIQATVESHDRHGIILIGAPQGHGLTTTCYAMLGRHDAYIANIKSLEREVLLQLDGPDQIQFDPTNPDVDYPTNLQSILRRDPDVVLVDEIRDNESATIIAESGLDGPLIYVPQVQPSIVEQIRAWVKLVGDVKEATRSLRLVINQRLVRKLCSNCNGSGYTGITAAFEVFSIDPEIRTVLGTGDLKAALALARRNKMVYLQEAAMSKVVSGETSVEEVIRVTSTAKEAKKDPSAAA
jgi:general secretion pathway protein E